MSGLTKPDKRHIEYPRRMLHASLGFFCLVSCLAQKHSSKEYCAILEVSTAHYFTFLCYGRIKENPNPGQVPVLVENRWTLHGKDFWTIEAIKEGITFISLMELSKDESESTLRKRVQEDTGFYTMVFPSTSYQKHAFESKIEDIAKYYENDGNIIEKVIFFAKDDRIYARINMQNYTQIDHLSAPTQ